MPHRHGIALAAALAVAAVATAQPANDNCPSAIEVFEGVTPYSTVGATSAGPNELACAFFGSSAVFNDIWFRFTAPCQALVTVSVCGSSYDTRLAVYPDACPAAGGTAITCNDDSCGLSSQVSFNATAGTSYLIRLGAYSSTGTGTGYLNITLTDHSRYCLMTYQGRLTDGNAAFTGPIDLRYEFFTTQAGGTAIGLARTETNVPVEGGLFTAVLEPAVADLATARFIELAVRAPAGVGDFVPLTPRQPLTAAPLAVRALVAESVAQVQWSELLGIPAGFADGLDNITTVTAQPGIVVGGAPGAVTVGANFAGSGVATTVARSDHQHSTLAAADGDPAAAVLVSAAGDVGIGEALPLARLHVANFDLGLDAAALESDEIIVEAQDAALGLYSERQGSWASAIALKEINAGVLVDTWGIARRPSNVSNPSSLHFTYGPSDNYAANPATMVLTNTGNVGIGTIAPATKLSVAGAVQSTTGGFVFPDATTQTTAAPTILRVQLSVDPPSLGSLAGSNVSITVPGAAVGDAVVANPGANLSTGYVMSFARVSATDTVIINFYNATTGALNPAASTWEIRIIK